MNTDDALDKLEKELYVNGGCYHHFIMINHKQAKCECCGLIADVKEDNS